jgi:hypothetical protein
MLCRISVAASPVPSVRNSRTVRSAAVAIAVAAALMRDDP